MYLRVPDPLHFGTAVVITHIRLLTLALRRVIMRGLSVLFDFVSVIRTTYLIDAKGHSRRWVQLVPKRVRQVSVASAAAINTEILATFIRSRKNLGILS
jgi:hypothetical protein